MKAMVFAAGLGTRLKPLTDTMPKALVPVCGHPLMEYTLLRLKAAGATEIVINVHHFAEQIIDYVAKRDWGIPVLISDERDCLLDTGGGLRKAAPLFTSNEDPILIHNVDIFSNADLNGFYAQSSSCDASLLVSRRETQRYLLFDDDMRLRGWTNTATGEVRTPFENLQTEGLRRYAFSGIHCFSTRLLERMKDFPQKFSIIDFYLSACAHANIRGHLQPDLRLLDVGKLHTLQEAEKWILNP